MKYIILILLCCSCAGIQPQSGFFGANQAGQNAAQGATDAANAGAMHMHHHTPPPMPMAAPGF